jgi:hypothetical protein
MDYSKVVYNTHLQPNPLLSKNYALSQTQKVSDNESKIDLFGNLLRLLLSEFLLLKALSGFGLHFLFLLERNCQSESFDMELF